MREMTINEQVSSRIVDYIHAKRLSRSEVAKMIGMKSATLVSQLNGTNGLSLEALGSIFDIFPDLNKEWVFSGEGPMEYQIGESKNPPMVTAVTKIKKLEDRIKELEQTVREKEAQVEVLKSLIKN